MDELDETRAELDWMEGTERTLQAAHRNPGSHKDAEKRGQRSRQERPSSDQFSPC